MIDTILQNLDKVKKAGKGYQPGQPNFVAIEGWNAATVYQKAIAIMGKKIDGG